MNDLLTRILEKIVGFDNLLKGMKDDFSSLNRKVNSHANEMNILEGKLTSLETQLATKTRMENDDNELEVVTHSGKIAI